MRPVGRLFVGLFLRPLIQQKLWTDFDENSRWLACIDLFITFAKEVIFSAALVSLLAALRKNYSTDFHKIRWKGGTWATETAVRLLR